MDYIPFNSQKEYHKYPFGAVREGEIITLRIILPRYLSCSAAFLFISDELGNAQRLPMNWECMEGNDQEWWTIHFSEEKRGLYWYHFVIDTNQGSLKITKCFESAGTISPDGSEYQLTVYSNTFQTPDYIKGGIIYQIFPDRFCYSGIKKSNIEKNRILHTNWNESPNWDPDEEGKINKYDFFMGDLKGIENKLDYIKSLGTNIIYLNPIFEAQSNHRYDTGNYEKIDSLLGDENDFASLCKKAKSMGISIILDGVFSHTGADSKYFNKFGNYTDLGAYNDKSSVFFSWYKFENWPNKYNCWWGVDVLPEIDETNESYIFYIKKILEKWMHLGASGWRLDVADELPDKFLDELRSTVKYINNDGLIIGEVWEDASNKISYSERRRYLLGEQLDSVMNYPFSDAIIDYVITGKSEGFNSKIMTICENYPKCAVDCLMNHIGTHDTCRILNRLATHDCYNSDHINRYRGGLDELQKSHGKTLLKIASTIQFTLPGIPSIYYGDEVGTDGGVDPFNRGTYPYEKEDKDLLDHYKLLGRIRNSYSVFKDGNYVPVSDFCGCVAYKRTSKDEIIFVVANRNDHDIDYFLPEDGFKSLTGEMVNGQNLHLPALTASILIKLRKFDET